MMQYLFAQALDNLSSSLQSGATYEGHEMLKTAFYRMRSRKKLHESYDIALVRTVLLFICVARISTGVVTDCGSCHLCSTEPCCSLQRVNCIVGLKWGIYF